MSRLKKQENGLETIYIRSIKISRDKMIISSLRNNYGGLNVKINQQIGDVVGK